MKNKVLNFELDSKSVKIKKLLSGDFLRLEAYTISDANPNRNQIYFTKSSMEQAIPTFFDKPVLAYYNPYLGPDGDFMGHECPNGIEYDEEMDSLYYDYTNPQSEIPIGTIRQSDTVELVNKDGLNWIRVTCVLWTKYNYKAVRSLLRSRNGKTKLSVEVEILRSHMDGDIEVVDEFQLDGFTLLGRNSQGREIEEGIEGARATAIDFLDENFAKHQKCLAFAYSALDNYNSQNAVKKIAEKPVDKRILEEGGTSDMQLTMQAKMDLLSAALSEALSKKEGEDECRCCVWVMDLCDKYVYYRIGDDKFRCPYAFVEVGEDHELTIDLDAQERVYSSWSVFEAQSDEQTDDQQPQQENFDHEEKEEHKCIECTIRDLIIDEEQAIQGYSHAEKHFGEEFPLIAKIFHELKEEEETHVGELQQCLQMVNDESQKHIEEGIQEAKDIIIEETLENQKDEEEVDPEKQEEITMKSFEDGSEGEVEEGDVEKCINSNVAEEAKQCEEQEEQEKCCGQNCEKQDNCDGKFEDDGDKNDDNDDKDDDDDDDKNDDDKDDDEHKKDEESKEEGEHEENCKFSNSIELNSEPNTLNVDGLTMSEIIEKSTESISAPEVQTEPEHLGEANAKVAATLNGVNEYIITGDPDTPNNDQSDPVEAKPEQPDDAQKGRDEFSTDAEIVVNGQTINVSSLLAQYNDLTAKYEAMNAAIKDQQAEKLIAFGSEFINADSVVDEESKKDFIAQVEQKCKNYEFSSEEEVTNFAKGLMAMYYYDHQSVCKETKKQELNLSLNKPNYNDGTASSSKLKDAINKLNYLNKEE